MVKIVSRTGLDPDHLGPFRYTKHGYNSLASADGVIPEELVTYGNPVLDTRSIARILLDEPRTAIMYLPDPNAIPRPDYLPDHAEQRFEPVMAAVNYHHGHSEGHHKIVIQDVRRPEEGQHLLWVPPSEDGASPANTTAYRRLLGAGSDEPYPFEETPTNSDKIGKYYIFTGDPAEVRHSFEDLGVTFSDEGLTDNHPEYRRLNSLSSRAEDVWQPGL